jgi:hypothetical protein
VRDIQGTHWLACLALAAIKVAKPGLAEAHGEADTALVVRLPKDHLVPKNSRTHTYGDVVR